MAVSNSKKDVSPWQVVNYQGKVMFDAKGNPLNKFDGYESAHKVAKQIGGVASRV